MCTCRAPPSYPRHPPSVDHGHQSTLPVWPAVSQDIKPENVLIAADNVLKVADFGSCRGIYSKQPYTEYISTRWYRAPECLLTDGYYGYKMDIWGIGCVIFEILALFPLFPGKNEADQIERIHKVLGTPPASLLEKFKKYSKHMRYTFKQRQGTGLRKYLPHVSDECISLLEQLLQYDPEERYTAKQALKHPWLADLRAEDRANKKAAKSGATAAPGVSASAPGAAPEPKGSSSKPGVSGSSSSSAKPDQPAPTAISPGANDPTPHAIVSAAASTTLPPAASTATKAAHKPARPTSPAAAEVLEQPAMPKQPTHSSAQVSVKPLSTHVSSSTGFPTSAAFGSSPSNAASSPSHPSLLPPAPHQSSLSGARSSAAPLPSYAKASATPAPSKESIYKSPAPSQQASFSSSAFRQWQHAQGAGVHHTGSTATPSTISNSSGAKPALQARYAAAASRVPHKGAGYTRHAPASLSPLHSGQMAPPNKPHMLGASSSYKRRQVPSYANKSSTNVGSPSYVGRMSRLSQGNSSKQTSPHLGGNHGNAMGGITHLSGPGAGKAGRWTRQPAGPHQGGVLHRGPHGMSTRSMASGHFNPGLNVSSSLGMGNAAGGNGRMSTLPVSGYQQQQVQQQAQQRSRAPYGRWRAYR